MADAGISRATVVGVCTHICVMETVGGLTNRDLKVRVPAAAVADFDPEQSRAALARMQEPVRGRGMLKGGPGHSCVLFRAASLVSC